MNMEKKEDKNETESEAHSGTDTDVVTGEGAEQKGAATVKTGEHKDEEAASVKTDEHKDEEANEAIEGNEQKKEEEEIKVVYKFRDFNRSMVKAWEEVFSEYCGEEDGVEVSVGDIFKGAPAADALVSPANSFGFMDGGIDMVYTRHFGWQMQHRLQEVIRKEHDGELLVGSAIIIPAYKEGQVDEEAKDEMYNEGQPIRYLISAPTMRIPIEVDTTPNSYLAFRAVILAVQKHNRRTDVEPIRSVLCPGLGTAVGQMPKGRCARQMLAAYETYVLGKCPTRLQPENLFEMVYDHEDLCFSKD